MDTPQTIPGTAGVSHVEGGVQWRPFLRALAEQIDALAGAAERDAMLRSIGARMAKLLPLPEVRSLETLEIEMNDMLAAIGWGRARLSLKETERALTITHTGLPRIGSVGNPPGTWLAALLEGLYETWMSQQPGSDPNLTARLSGPTTPDAVTLRFGRG
jgi:Cellulose synthase subunit D